MQGQAQRDPLTGLYNRRGLEQSVAGRYSLGLPPGAAVQVRIDHFREISDSYGQLLGDRVIATVAQIISAVAGSDALCARSSGENFILLLPEVAPQAAAATAEQIRSGVEKCRIRRQDSEAIVEAVTVSIGIGSIAEGETLAAAGARAEQALQRAIDDGRNRVFASGND